MFSLINYFLKKVFNKDDNSIKENSMAEEENVQQLLAQIEDIRANDNQIKHQFNLVNNDQGCFYKTGIITHINNEYIVIENKYMCEIKYVIPTDLRKGDKVYYMAFKTHKNELKVCKIEYKIEELWESEINETANNEQILNNNASNSDKIVQIREINQRTIIGKVEKRIGREIYLNVDNISFSLDDVSSNFVPVIGDWMKLECLVEVNENIPNLKGEVLEIQKLLPLRQLCKTGIVTNFFHDSNYGIIDKIILFSQFVCMSGYKPRRGDSVIAQSIESDQGTQQWRALTVVPIEVVCEQFDTSIIKFKPSLSEEEIAKLIKDKENIDITNNICITLDATAEKEFDVTIKNNGNIKQNIIKCEFSLKFYQSQIKLVLPDNNKKQQLCPSDEVIYKFKCKARFIGISEELVIFNFEHFKIGRIVQITVNSINLKNQKSKEESDEKYTNNKQSIIPPIYEDGTYIKGIKPYTSTKFNSVHPVTLKIPSILWTTIEQIELETQSHTEAELLLADKIPFLKQPLSFQNYKQRFNYLLHLEEIGQILNLQKFNMRSATLHASGEYLTLKVEGLAEKRPSLIIGDRVIISFKWDRSNGQQKYEGYIHKIKSCNVFLKFHEVFHQKYHGEDCQVSFIGSNAVIKRCHSAINVVVKNLGSEFLFPKKVVQKDPKYYFIENEIDDDQILNTSPQLSITNVKEIKQNAIAVSTKKLTWFNKNLNQYQKEAIRNILKGLARPLPYIIFGPPGTGKTITLCEVILQIFFTMTESRILIATPSNSSANLITERLLDSNLLKPGDLVRLVAHYYLENIPERLLPYCVTGDTAVEGSKLNVNISDPRGCRVNVTLSVLCRHRIIVSTCTTSSVLYNMGCKPGHFTHVIVDESGQAKEPEIMIPLSLSHANSTQVVLAGDPKQLGPICQSRLAGYFGLNDSFLVRLLQQCPYQEDPIGFTSGYDPRLVTKLLMNYRSLPELLDLPNKLFYGAELIPQVDPDKSEEAELVESLLDMLPKRLGSPPTIIFHGVDGKNMKDSDSPSWYNPEEATQVYIYLLELYNHDLKPEDIGIITPYSKQVYRIKNLLEELELEIPKVGTVEEFQGQERKVIILSTVRTAKDKIEEDVRHALGFVSARERLNVAITRARSLLIIVGNSDLLKQDVYWREVIDYCSTRNSCINVKMS